MRFIPACITASALIFTGGLCAFTGFINLDDALLFPLAALAVLCTVSRLPQDY